MSKMRIGLVKILIVIFFLIILWSSVSANEKFCPRSNRDLPWSFIDPWQTVDNKVVYY